MKKLLMTLVALICMAVTASAQTVYIATGDGAVAYHKSKSCSYLTNSKNVKSVTTAEAKKLGRHECTRCYGTAAPTKKTTPAAKKTTPSTKKTTPARDEKGRFIKKTDTKNTTDAKKTDTKKSTDAKKKTTDTKTKKTTPARDEKGRFIKTTDSKKTTKKAA